MSRSSLLTGAVAAGFALSLLGAGTALANVSSSDLEVVRIDPDAITPGGVTTVRGFVANKGPDRTASPFSVVVTLPDGVVPEGPIFPANCQTFPQHNQVRCSFPPGLGTFQTATALIPVRVDPGIEGPATLRGCVQVYSRDDRNTANNRQPFDIQVNPAG
ncbi:hypothetical protein ACIBG7_35905 [Nonomuraea sp. NPDC050328]|uniref:hypothetical protein n=1 Tax=Nonomuraea sp. NPDC050328 TaxID=3364361 RepID=UPI00379CA9C1